MNIENPAVVLGLNPNGLHVVPSLRAAGTPVIGVDRAPEGFQNGYRWMRSKTRLCRKDFNQLTEPDSLLECPEKQIGQCQCVAYPNGTQRYIHAHALRSVRAGDFVGGFTTIVVKWI